MCVAQAGVLLKAPEILHQRASRRFISELSDNAVPGGDARFGFSYLELTGAQVLKKYAHFSPGAPCQAFVVVLTRLRSPAC